MKIIDRHIIMVAAAFWALCLSIPADASAEGVTTSAGASAEGRTASAGVTASVEDRTASAGVTTSAEDRTASAGYYDFMVISRENGVPSGVSCICAEDRGYVWIGTQEGLLRYDGHSYSRYTRREGDENSLPSDDVLKVVQDSLKNIWVLTSGGPARYRPQTDDFYVPDQSLQSFERVKTIRSAFMLPDGILFGGQNIIYKYSYSEDKISLYLRFNANPFFPVEEIAPWRDGKILCFNRWLGILAVETAQGGSVRLSRPLSCNSENLGMLVDSQQRVWLSPYNRGIECHGADGSLLATYNTGNSALSNDIVLCMVEHEGKIWAGTDGGGINVIDPQTRDITVIRHIPGDSNSLPDNSIRTLYFDGDGNVWAGQVKGGLCVIHEVWMQHFGAGLPGSTTGLSEKSVNCIYQEPHSGCVWVGTNGEGLNKFDPVKGTFTHYPATAKIKITSITSFAPGELLLSTFSRDLFIFDKHSGSVTPLTIANQDFEYQKNFSGKSVNLQRESDNATLLLTDSLYRYRHDIGKLYNIGLGNGSVGTLQPIGVRDGKSYLHDSEGIYAVSSGSGSAERILRFGSDTTINSVTLGEDGIFRVASNKGAGSYNPSTGRYTHIHTTLFRSAQSVVLDRHKRLWIGTDHDLFAYLTDSQRFILFDESDGAYPNEYRPKAKLLAGNGDVYLGGVNGLLHIDGDLTIGQSEDFDIVLTDVELDGRRVNDLITDGHLRASWENKLFRIKVMSRDNNILRKKLYRFRVNGYFDEPIETYEPEIELRFPSPGRYSVEVSCNTKDGRWLPWNQVLAFTVVPPWYKTLWFEILCSLLAALAVLAVVYAILRVRQKRIEAEYREKEKRMNEEKISFLINICHELKTPLTLVGAPIKQLSRNASKESLPYLDMIRRQARRMKDLVDSVLLVRKMEVQDTTLSLKPHELNSWAEQSIEDFRTEAELRGISLNFKPDDSIGTVYFDEKKCLVVLNNFMVNALNHSPDNSEIIVRTERDTVHGFVRVVVTDHGSGLGDADIDRLFKRFYQGKGESSGTGIGLSVSQIFVEQHGGHIGAVNNADCSGATFYFELPAGLRSEEITCPSRNYLNEIFAARQAVEAGQTAGADLEEDLLPDLSEITVLIVDDEKELTDFFGKTLSQKFGQVLTANNGAQALEILTNEGVDIVVSDVNMPEMDGYSLCREIKTNIEISHIPIILMTGYDDERNRLLGYKNGADGYLTKPFDADMLLTRIGNILRNRELARMKYRQTAGDASTKDITFSSADEAFIIRLNALIMDNLTMTEFDTSSICQEIGMSRTALFNKLKSITGMGIKDYIGKLRMEKAVELISSTEMTISQISDMTGFSTPRYFSTAFKQYTGKTPSEYRSTLNHQTH